MDTSSRHLHRAQARCVFREACVRTAVRREASPQGVGVGVSRAWEGAGDCSMIRHGRMSVVEPQLVHPVVQAAMSRGQHQTHTLKGSIVGSRTHRVQVG